MKTFVIFFTIDGSVVILWMFWDIKMIDRSIKTLVIIDKICLILLIWKILDLIKETQEEMDGSWLIRGLCE